MVIRSQDCFFFLSLVVAETSVDGLIEIDLQRIRGFACRLQPASWQFLMQENSACAMDGEFYCAQQTASILMHNAKCFAQFKMPASGSESCTPECVDLWKKEKAEHPACMKIFAGQIKDSW